MEPLPKFHENPVGWVFLFGTVGFIAFFILACIMNMVDIPPDTTPRPLEQILCFVIFSCAALALLIFRDCGGPSWLVSSFFVAQISCILVAVFGGYWWYSHSEEVGDPLLFANAFVSLCWTYPFVEWFFISLRNGVEEKISAGFAGLWCIVCLIPLLSYIYVVANRYADPDTNIMVAAQNRNSRRWEQSQRLNTERGEAQREAEVDARVEVMDRLYTERLLWK